MKKLIPLFGLLILTGCADLNTNAFRAEKLAADTGVAGVRSFNAYYQIDTNGASPAKIDELNKTRDQVYDASRKLSAMLSVVEASRLIYGTNATPATEGLLRNNLSLLSANAGSVTNLVANAMAPYSTIK